MDQSAPGAGGPPHPPGPPYPPPGAYPGGYPPPGAYPGGYPPPRRGFPGWAIALIVVGALVLVFGVIAAVSIPAFQQYRLRAKTTEASPNLKKIFDGAKTYYESRAVAPTGGAPRGEATFPASVGLTPARPCCKQAGRRCPATRWEHPTWQTLGFEISDRHYFQYRFASAGSGAGAIFTAGAHADLDCDGTLSTYERTGAVDAELRVQGSRDLYIDKGLE